MTAAPEDVSLRQACKRGVLGRCPACGQGKLFARFLKQVDNCLACGEHFAGLRADDAAPWLTIIVLGHVFLPLAFLLDLEALMPRWLALSLWALVFTALAVALLPHAKGVMLGILWQTKATGEPRIMN